MSCGKKKNSSTSNTKANIEVNKDISVFNYNELEPLLYTEKSNVHIINFWAMWCAPCVKELPYLQAYVNKNSGTDLLLISMDFTEDIETKLKPFLKEKNITQKVVLLDDPDANTWINKIDPNWSGAIPFTIIFNNTKRMFYERPFDNLQDLENEINKNFK